MRHASLSHLIICLVTTILAAACGAAPATSVPSSTPMPTNTAIPPTAAPTITPTHTAAPTNRPLLLAHYMPWFQTPAVTGSWGWHWTMNHFKPDQKDANGQPIIASYYHPLTGPYDSNDDALLEYQVLLMKSSGIDGVIVDWYGIENFLDYGMLNDSTRKLFQYVKKAGLLFAICYEDVTVKNMIQNGHLAADEGISHGQKVMRFLQDNWFRDDTYWKVSGRPVLFLFGNPPYFRTKDDWQTLFSGLNPTPLLVTEDEPLSSVPSSSYPWPPMSLSINGELTQERLSAYLEAFYKKGQGWEVHVASAFPGFHDIYKEAGVGSGYGYLDARKGETFKATLQAALQSNPDAIQLVTWNDYGEGTNIEPTVEYGTQYLEIVQDIRRASGDPAFAYSSSDLALPLKLFNLRKQHKSDAEVNARLDKAFEDIIVGKLDDARTLLSQ